MNSAPGVPALVRGLCDDAALFPPGNAPMRRAIDEHLARRDTTPGALAGPFVVPDTRLGELEQSPAGRPLTVSVTVPAGVDAVADALEHVRRLDNVTVAGLEVPLPADPSAHTVESLLASATNRALYLEIPRDWRTTDWFTRLAGTGVRVKLRTGGITAEAFPGTGELAAAIVATVGAGIAFKATAGLHQAVRHTDPLTGFGHHGFANILVATAAARRGAPTDEVAQVLADEDRRSVGAALRGLDSAVRSSFLSYGTCNIDEPFGDLVDLHPS